SCGRHQCCGRWPFSLWVQPETLPYKYVSVEGPIVAVEAADLGTRRTASRLTTPPQPTADRWTTISGRFRCPGSAPCGYLSLIAAFTLAAISGGIVAMLCACLACAAPLAMTSASSLPSSTALQPGMRSPQLS